MPARIKIVHLLYRQSATPHERHQAAWGGVLGRLNQIETLRKAKEDSNRHCIIQGCDKLHSIKMHLLGIKKIRERLELAAHLNVCLNCAKAHQGLCAFPPEKSKTCADGSIHISMLCPMRVLDDDVP
ncbi:unnamed protein product, partial [Mesorhabditis spiculigera]